MAAAVLFCSPLAVYLRCIIVRLMFLVSWCYSFIVQDITFMHAAVLSVLKALLPLSDAIFPLNCTVH